ncbi:hypothetical protein G1C96_1253 [Bifidobacterium sp. DSM 109958]|uniref:DUF2510 domain-containing protein n=1 Tax=Bifidobacterium moraviense TaxID=2675323 RepID=A0A7Y0F277_9BIFI|nr:DUF2510 domain-containing protein [Bifidobacterium sp. DSM 109958]NMN00674.1 hypothetical protein [Bifidobacterium sp. DSM 109958]
MAEAEAQPGWYPDPSGDPDRLRWWDGEAWAEYYAPAPKSRDDDDDDDADNNTDQADWQSDRPSAPSDYGHDYDPAQGHGRHRAPQSQSQPQQPYAQTSGYGSPYPQNDYAQNGYPQNGYGQPPYAQPNYAQYSQTAYAQTSYAQPQTPGPQQPGYAPQSQPFPYAQSPVPQQPYPPQQYGQQYGQYGQYGAGVTLTDTDRTLRLIAFVLNLLTTVALCWLFVPLIWMIPMTVHTWSLYKGDRPNTVGFGVCNLIFLNSIAGVLLLVSTKNV